MITDTTAATDDDSADVTGAQESQLNKATRNAIRAMVGRCRTLLEESATDQLQSDLAIQPSGQATDESSLPWLTTEAVKDRRRVVAYLAHLKAGGLSGSDAFSRLVREIAYTHLNRFCAYKMMARRGVFATAVDEGLKSEGFIRFLADHPNDEYLAKSGEQHHAYRNYLAFLGAELSSEVGALFSALHPANTVFPPAPILGQVLDLVNAPELESIWDSEETIGWVYQYFTPKEQREKARKESPAPRNSYELSFLN